MKPATSAGVLTPETRYRVQFRNGVWQVFDTWNYRVDSAHSVLVEAEAVVDDWKLNVRFRREARPPARRPHVKH